MHLQSGNDSMEQRASFNCAAHTHSQMLCRAYLYTHDFSPTLYEDYLYSSHALRRLPVQLTCFTEITCTAHILYGDYLYSSHALRRLPVQLTRFAEITCTAHTLYGDYLYSSLALANTSLPVKFSQHPIHLSHAPRPYADEGHPFYLHTGATLHLKQIKPVNILFFYVTQHCS